MYSDWSVFAGLAAAVIFIWMGILSFLVWQSRRFLRSLFPKSGEREIRVKFEEILKQIVDFEQDLDKLKEKLSEVNNLGLKHIQRVELIRYNPYDDTGGDQSFTLALLDKNGTGLVLTSL